MEKLEYFNVDRLRPEQVRTIEAGYRGTHAEKFYIDASAYHSWYTDFIGYLIGLSAQFDGSGYPAGGIQSLSPCRQRHHHRAHARRQPGRELLPQAHDLRRELQLQ
ncbi:MAG: TonB-dependent receptor [Flavobacteriales bacterium]|nr:TonB-dependent receptor [Flavobacteriales bacterium]